MRVDTIDERLALFRQMMIRAGFDPQFPLTPDEALRAGAQRCLGCQSGEECRDWLRQAEPGAPVPDFCRNAAHFAEWASGQVTVEQDALDEAVHSLDR